MRLWLAACLHGIARRLSNDARLEHVSVYDEYGICRWRLEVAGDDTHGVTTEYANLPEGWTFIMGNM